MIFFRRVTGDSMSPTLSDGQIVIFHQIKNFKVGQIATAFVDKKVIKRIIKIDGDKIFLGVDDQKHAHNGTFYATVNDKNIDGVVFWPRNL